MRLWRGALTGVAVAIVVAVGGVLLWRKPPAPAVAVQDPGARDAGPRPNVVVILVDTLRADHLPLYGYGRDTAPFLSTLAASSTVFDATWSTSAWTAPATASVFTSLYPFQHGVVMGFWATKTLQESGVKLELNRLPADVETMGEAMARAGYATYGVAANVNVGSDIGFTRGFKKFKTFPHDEPASVVNEKVLAWKSRLQEEKPYLLYVHYLDPHAPYVEVLPWFVAPGDPEQRKMAAYDSEIRSVDEHLRVLYDAFGWKDNTFLMVMADHGEEFADHGWRGHGQTLYNEMLHVPLLVRTAGGAPARRVLGAASLLDILPTLRAVAGLPRDVRDMGQSLLPAVGGAGLPRDRVLLGHLHRRDQGDRTLWSISDGTWKHIEASTGQRMLFHLPEDPKERQNRFPDSVRLADAMRNEYQRVQRTSRHYQGDRQVLELDPETVESLKALGYAN